ncbi:Re/Si-specific NAD(P)(+) transhydrogenase subunit alpha [Cyanobacterium sp. IPPAS B-1200]|uniref:Re/Si-specific NAD(P)(+) transhydrogenase subunit alpha n=1 Tax=Cyanobacterium sp. IPPAS B-1200 TaxID=1562720 RepID=UPI0008526042|nr:Re/Si-specific NAD(P)(+) transhydrogenase subunit alpha [Cyanobacterium sp. IPPAS B-1200]OEJ77909.1 NAD(P) transhydrogenase subunit alpha [Cyanobacterium sp. IPPAS B-1200]
MTATLVDDQEVDAKKTSLKIAIPREIYPNECRVSATPDTVQKLQKLGFEVLVETGAGEKASFDDRLYTSAGCKIVENREKLWQEGNIILKVRPPEPEEIELLTEDKTLISFIYPAQNPDLLAQLAEKKATVFAMDAVPRISRAQKLDALSSMANIAGYRAVIEAANNFGRFFTGQITAAGKVPPAKVLVIGAGVAGLAAIGAAKSLGAIVRVFDTRLVVKEQIESLGGEFLEIEFAEDGSGEGGYAKTMSKEFIDAEMALFAEQAEEVDIIITTALIPGKPAPKLITEEMVKTMRQGSVIVDLAAQQGGNCEVTKPNEIYQYHGVTIIGLTDLPSRMASQSSQLYGTNLWHLLKDMGGNDKFTVNLEDEVIRGALVTYQGDVTFPPPKIAQPSPATAVKSEAKIVSSSEKQQKKGASGLVWLILGIACLIGIGIGAPTSFLSHFTVFILACFVGWQVIWNVAPALHTPLMSVTNAISGIIIIGGMLQISGDIFSPTTILGAIAILVGTINICGGFLVTQRMLKMFRRIDN